MSIMKQSISLSILTMLLINSGWADSIVVPHAFSAGTAAVASDVNENFSALANAIDDKDARLEALEAAVVELQRTVERYETVISQLDSVISQQQLQISSLESDLAAQDQLLAYIEENPVLELEPFIQITKDKRGPMVRLSGMNLQIVNGEEEKGTESINGLGNLIIGYDEENPVDNINFQHCANGQFKDELTCLENGSIWSNSHKSGSHNIVLGTENSYSSFGGLVGGKRNFITNGNASVLSGFGNAASGAGSGIVGGRLNKSQGLRSVVAGGAQNTVEQDDSSIGGGSNVELDKGVEFGTWAAGSLVEEP